MSKEEIKETVLRRDNLILGENYYVSLDDRKTGVNANVCVVGAPSSGKTRSVVLPNILNAKEQSLIVSDPKGRLYKDWTDTLRNSGRKALILDFTDSSSHSITYNPFAYIRTTQDTMQFAHLLAHQPDSVSNIDPFWDLSAETFISALVAYLKFHCPKNLQNLRNLSSLLSMAKLNDVSEMSQVDIIMEKVRSKDPEAFCIRQWNKVRCAPLRTYQSVLLTASAKLACLDTPEIENLTTGKNSLDFEEFIDKPTVLFVTVSDTDRSMDNIASLFMTQAYSELVHMADHSDGGRLDRHITFILDDYASSLQIPNLDKILSASRSRNISSMVILQNEGQLKQDAEVITGSCDNYIFLGTGDLKTCQNVAARADIDISTVINQKLHRSIVFRRGTSPVINQKNFDLQLHKELYQDKESQSVDEGSRKPARRGFFR